MVADKLLPVLEVVPGSVWRRRRHRSPPPPWTALPTWPGWCSPRIDWPDLCAGGWSTFPRCGWIHPDAQRGAARARQTGKTRNRWETNIGGETVFALYLPHGFDPLLEEVEVTVSTQVTRTDQMTVESPKLLHLKTQTAHDGWHQLVETWAAFTKRLAAFFKCNQECESFKVFLYFIYFHSGSRILFFFLMPDVFKPIWTITTVNSNYDTVPHFLLTVKWLLLCILFFI